MLEDYESSLFLIAEKTKNRRVSMDLMLRAPEEICTKIDALSRRFLKSCGYKITNYNDKRQRNRVLNRLERNGKELTHRQVNAEDKSIYFWFELVDIKDHTKVYRKSDVLHFTFNEMQYNGEESGEELEVNLDILQKMLEKGV